MARKQRLQLLTSAAQDADRFDHAGGCDLYPALPVNPAVGDEAGLWKRDRVCRHLGIGLSTLANLRADHVLVPHRQLTWLYIPEEVEAFRLGRHLHKTSVRGRVA